MTEQWINIYECENCSAGCIVAVKQDKSAGKLDLVTVCPIESSNRPKFKMILTRSDFYRTKDKASAIRKLKESLTILDGL
jgi:hypothetical protein